MPSVDHRKSATALQHACTLLFSFTHRSWQKFFVGKNLVTANIDFVGSNILLLWIRRKVDMWIFVKLDKKIVLQVISHDLMYTLHHHWNMHKKVQIYFKLDKKIVTRSYLRIWLYFASPLTHAQDSMKLLKYKFYKKYSNSFESTK